MKSKPITAELGETLEREERIPAVVVKSGRVKDYLALPKEEREVSWGPFRFYRKMSYFSGNNDVRDLFGNDSEGAKWDKEISKRYPVQFFFREWLLSYDNPIYRFFSIKKRRIEDFYWNLRNYIKPAHWRAAKAARPFGWQDMDHKFVQTSLAFLLDFFYEEFSTKDHIDWKNPQLSDFVKELKENIDIVEKEIPELQKREKELYDQYLSSSEWLKELTFVEEKIKHLESQVLYWMVKNRDHFWT